ncbi:MAG: hypothetical protein P1V36_13560 [Planctomycetota bacterium]|nr:hypothetical protein [Planctomycetota bacterium]
MTDDPNLEDDVLAEDALDAGAEEAYEAMAEESGVDAGAILEEAKLERMHRQAYWHTQSKQLFAFLFANCCFFASGFAAWTRAGYNEDGSAALVDPSLLFTGLDTIRGSLLFALALYGFWTAAFNIWHAQMKVWPYLLGGILGLWVGVGGIVSGVGGEQWERSKLYLSDHLESKTMMDDILTPLGTIAPGYWLCAFGGLIVVWVIVMGLVQGGQSAKATATESGGSGRRRR